MIILISETKKYQENHHDCDLTSATLTTAPSLGQDPTLVGNNILHFVHLCISAQIRISQLSQKDHLSSATPTAATPLGRDPC